MAPTFVSFAAMSGSNTRGYQQEQTEPLQIIKVLGIAQRKRVTIQRCCYLMRDQHEQET